MAKISVQEAIKTTGKSRAYLYKLMKAGGLSFTHSPDGHRLLDVAELLRAVGPFKSAVDNPRGQQKTLMDGSETAASFSMTAFSVLETELKAAQEKLERLEREHRRELDSAQLLMDAKDAHIQTLTKINDGLLQRLLAAPSPSSPVQAASEQPSSQTQHQEQPDGIKSSMDALRRKQAERESKKRNKKRESEFNKPQK